MNKTLDQACPKSGTWSNAAQVQIPTDLQSPFIKSIICCPKELGVQFLDGGWPNYVLRCRKPVATVVRPFCNTFKLFSKMSTVNKIKRLSAIASRTRGNWLFFLAEIWDNCVCLICQEAVAVSRGITRQHMQTMTTDKKQCKKLTVTVILVKTHLDSLYSLRRNTKASIAINNAFNVIKIVGWNGRPSVLILPNLALFVKRSDTPNLDALT